MCCPLRLVGNITAAPKMIGATSEFIIAVAMAHVTAINSPLYTNTFLNNNASFLTI